MSTSLLAQKKERRTPRKAEDSQKIELTSLSLRLKMDDFFILFSGEVEQAADSILVRSEDKLVREQALLWKSYAIPAAQRATMQRDPFSSLIDAAVLCFQMSDYFDYGKGKSAFKAQQQIAITTSSLLTDEIRFIAKSLSEDRDISEGETLLRSYAKEHPIQSIYFVRENAAYLFDAYGKVEKVGFKKLAKAVNANLEDLISRLNIYTENLPKQIRWQSELMIEELFEKMTIEGTIDSISEPVFAKMDSLITSHLERVHLMVNQSLTEVDSQRLFVTDDLTKERKIILQTLRQERLETIAELKKERALILDFFSQEKTAVLQKIDSLTNENIESSLIGINNLASQSIDASLSGTDQLLDRLFKKIYLFSGFLFIMGIIFVYLARLTWQAKK